MENVKIHIVTAADEKYMPHVGAMLHSLFENNADLCFKIHFLHSQSIRSTSHLRIMRLCEKFGHAWEPQLIDSTILNSFPSNDTYPAEAWLRLRLPSLLPNVDKAIWLDADLLVLRSIKELWATNLNGHPLAAVNDILPIISRHIPKLLGLDSRDKYFNSGVMILDLKLMRSIAAEQKMSNYLSANINNILHADQDVLNGVFQNTWAKLSRKWNVTAATLYFRSEVLRLHGLEEYREALKTPAIVHFTGGKRLKPWSYSSPHPYRQKYIYHRLAAGWPAPDIRERRALDFIRRIAPLRLLILASMLKKGQIRNFIETL